jgi:hypothetical protein
VIPTIAVILAALFLAFIPAAYYFGRRSAVNAAVDRVLARETDRHRATPDKEAS